VCTVLELQGTEGGSINKVKEETEVKTKHHSITRDQIWDGTDLDISVYKALGMALQKIWNRVEGLSPLTKFVRILAVLLSSQVPFILESRKI
jgi:hypothetical protein